MAGVERTGRYSAVVRESQPQLAPSLPAPVQADPQTTSDAEAAGRVTVAHGRFRMSLPATVVLAALTCLGGYFASAARKPADDPGPLLQEWRQENAAAVAARSQELGKLETRLGNLETRIGTLQATVDGANKRIDDFRSDMLGSAPRDPMAPGVSAALRGH
jgi:hypothetical protein